MTTGVDVLVLPWGSEEEHGPLLPPSTDTIIATHIAHQVSLAVPGARLLPSVPYGSAREHSDFATTISLDVVTLIALARNIFTMQAPGPALLVVVNGHAGNQDALSAAAADANYGHGPIKTIVEHVFPEPTRDVARSRLGSFDAHAGSAEGSIMAAIGRAVKAERHGMSAMKTTTTPPGALRLWRTYSINQLGIVSDQEELIFDPDIGQEMIEASTRHILTRIAKYRSLMIDMQQSEGVSDY